MKLLDNEIQLSASDLANHLGCRHLTWLDLQSASGAIKAPKWHEPRLEALIKRGLQHEAAYLEHLETQGRDVTRLPRSDSVDTGAEDTLAAMGAGVDCIVQATLTSGRWLGYADVLMRVETPSALGDWSYEVIDTKLARETRAGTILQLSLYSHVVGELQGHIPEQMYVVSPGRDFEPESYRVLDFAAYYRYVRGRLEEAAQEVGDEPCYPEPVAQCDVCRWWADCRDRRRVDDHLSLVAGISKLQIGELEKRKTKTVADLAAVTLPIQWKPARGTRAGLKHVREQARVQVEGQDAGQPVFEFLPLEPDRGLARLPEPSPGDMFFDIEGGRFVGEHGLEYLLAFVRQEGSHDGKYEHQWAFNAKQEREAFEWFVDMVMERWSCEPGMHIYHYAPYEPSALKRLMGRYATREDEVDRMLRGGLFVDLYHVVRQAIRASVESYSIKELELFYGFERPVDLRAASAALRHIENALELGQELEPGDEELAVVVGYNKDDCVSTLRLRDWLETLRAERLAAGEEILRPVAARADPSEKIDERQQRVNALKQRLLEDIPAYATDRNYEDTARALVAEMLDWHRRESKASWWQYYHLQELTELELLEEKAALAGIELVERVGGTERCPIDRYQYPQQDMDIRRGDELHLSNGDTFGKVDEIDRIARRIDVKKAGAMKEVHPAAFFSHSVVRTEVLAESLFRFGDRVATRGFESADAYSAASDLLLRSRPRLLADGQLRLEAEPTLDTACRVVGQLAGSYLPIQGPPGSGKTYTAAHMIRDLVQVGKKVGVTAVSHKVIRNLLDKVAVVAGEAAICGQKVRARSGTDPEELRVVEFTDNARARSALREGELSVLGGTAWLWAREDFEQSVDVLFIDEAGQMSLTNALAVAPAAQSLVLTGDPQQLEQPQQGSHPEGTDVSALEHILGEDKTMPPERGLFLDETWRLHPEICALTSELFYESRLSSRPELSLQSIKTGAIRGAGLWLHPVEHCGNQSSSLEEAEAVEALVTELLAGAPSWTDQHGQTQPLSLHDILIVAPYNAQVSAIGERIRAARVGTVDKFQGQEAPIVIYSMATSSHEDAPRGMEFLYSPNRLNVATSRARCACILVANPRLFNADCKTPAQMRLANAFCRYAEMARAVGIQ